MTTTDLSLTEIYDLALKTLRFNGCDELNGEAVANTVTNAERDGSVSHGLFRIPGYISALKSIKHISEKLELNQNLTAEVTPHHLGFSEDLIKSYDTNVGRGGGLIDQIKF